MYVVCRVTTVSVYDLTLENLRITKLTMRPSWMKLVRKNSNLTHTFGQFPQLFGRKYAGRCDGVIADNPVVRIMWIA